MQREPLPDDLADTSPLLPLHQESVPRTRKCSPWLDAAPFVGVLLVVTLIVTLVHTLGMASVPPPPPSLTQLRLMINVSAGVEVAVLLSVPDGFALNGAGPAFPVVAEMLPYRQQDLFYSARYPLWAGLVGRGMVFAAVDLPGTGASTGPTIPKEYSDEELHVAQQVIAWLAAQPWSTGRVGLVGKSWSAFNALMLAMRRTPYLAAIYVAHGSEDLFFNDVHYPEGAMHFDDYIFEQANENVLPRGPEMTLDAQWVKDRLNAPAWVDVYLRHMDPSSGFYRNNSLKYHYDQVQIPVYLLAGLFDEYRDFALRIYEGIRKYVPQCRVVVGPLQHKFAFESTLLPTYDDRPVMSDWLQHYLQPNASLAPPLPPGKDVVLYLTHSYPPASTNLPGFFVQTDWPITSVQPLQLYPSANGTLLPSAPAASASRPLPYQPNVGARLGAGFWNTVPNLAHLDQQSLVYDHGPLRAPLTVVGWVHVCLGLSVDANVTLARWAVRLEDVDPEGVSTFITGGLFTSRYTAGLQTVRAGEPINVCGDLLFMSHTFDTGRVLRVAVTNGLWRAWQPSPQHYTTTLALGPRCVVTLPVVPASHDWGAEPTFPLVPVAAVVVPTATDYDSGPDVQHITKESVFVADRSMMHVDLDDVFIGLFYSYRWVTSATDPTNSTLSTAGVSLVVRGVQNAAVGPQLFHEVRAVPSLIGDHTKVPFASLPFIDIVGRFFRIETRCDLSSNATHFVLHVSWNAYESLLANPAPPVYQRVLDAVYPRVFQ